MKNETLTKCICHKGFSGYSSNVARSKFHVGGQETATQSLTAHTLDRCAQLNKTDILRKEWIFSFLQTEIVEGVNLILCRGNLIFHIIQRMIYLI
jgi:hypothetical protein